MTKNRSTIQLLHIYIHTNIHIYLKNFGKSKIEQNRVYKTFKTLHYAVKEKKYLPSTLDKNLIYVKMASNFGNRYENIFY